MTGQRRALRTAAATLCLLSLVGGAWAGAGDSESLEREFGFVEAEELEKIPVSVATRGEKVPFGLAPAVTDVIPEEEIRASGARTLAELLSQRVGIDVSADRLVPRGVNTAPSVGTPLFNHRTLLLIDGRPANGVFFGEFLAGRELPLEHVARIEIVRGPGSAAYGTNAMAGVINVVTKDAADVQGVGVVGETGTHSTRRVDAYGGIGDAGRNANAFFRYYATGGADEPNRHDNEREFFGFARSTIGPLTLQGEALQFRDEVPGTRADRIDRERFSIGAAVARALGPEFSTAGRVYANLYQNRFLVTASRPDRSTYDDRRVGEELSLTYRPWPWLSVSFGGEARQEAGEVGRLRCIERAASGIRAAIGGCDLDRDVFAAFLEDQIELFRGATLTAGFRYDEVTDVGGRASPRASLVWSASPSTTWKIGYGEAFRAPSFFELRGAQRFGSETLVVGNPDLDSEVVRTVDGGISHRFSRFVNVRLSGFFTRGEDLIVQAGQDELAFAEDLPEIVSEILGAVPDAAVPPELLRTRFRFVNAARVDVAGLEAAAGGILSAPRGELAYGLNYTFQDTSNDRLGGADLPLAPSHKLNLLLDYRPMRDVSLFWHTRWEDRQFADARERRAISSHFQHNLHLLYRWSRSVQAGLGIYNVANSDEPDAADVPREPLAVLASLRYEFSPGPPLAVSERGLPEPAELGEARAALERARAAEAERHAPSSFAEAARNLEDAEDLARTNAPRAEVIARARRAITAADEARRTRAPAPSAAVPPAAPTAAPTAAVPARQRPAVPTRGVSTPERPTPRATPTAPPETPSPTATATPTVRQTATPKPTPTPTPEIDLGSRRVLLVQSDSAVEVYAEAAATLIASLPGVVELQDLGGDRERGAESVRDAAARADLVVAVGALGATVARREAADRPVLFCAVLNPQRYDLAGRNVGGVSFEVSAATQLRGLAAALPQSSRVGVMYDPAKSAAFVAEAERAAKSLGLEIAKAVVREPRDVGFVLRSLRKDIDVLLLIPDSTVLTRESFEVIRTVAAETRTPLVAFSEAFARQGALLAFYPDAAAVGEQCAGLATRVLKGEIRPEGIGIRSPAEVQVVVNRRVEDLLGVAISDAVRPDVEVR